MACNGVLMPHKKKKKKKIKKRRETLSPVLKFLAPPLQSQHFFTLPQLELKKHEAEFNMKLLIQYKYQIKKNDEMT